MTARPFWAVPAQQPIRPAGIGWNELDPAAEHYRHLQVILRSRALVREPKRNVRQSRGDSET
jgi:hypothetical protein